MTTHLVRIEVCGDHVHIHGLPEHLEAPVGAALLDGATVQDLAKADADEEVDPAWPQFAALLDGSLRPWDEWLDWLIDELLRLNLRKGPDAALAAAIQQRLREHEAGVIAATTGSTTDAETVRALVRRGDLPATYPTTAPVPEAFALGLGSDPTTPRLPGATHTPAQPRTATELGALSYARDRAAAYMRRPVSALHRVVTAELAQGGVPLDARALTPEERALVAREVVRAVGEGASTRELERRLKEAVKGNPQLTNDMERVARTEMANALNHGALAALKARLRPGEDPLVYRLASPKACKECRRIYGHPDNPVRYRLSFVEAREAAGGNYGLPASQWGPTVGATHPRCLCSPILRYSARSASIADKMVGNIRRGGY